MFGSAWCQGANPVFYNKKNKDWMYVYHQFYKNDNCKLNQVLTIPENIVFSNLAVPKPPCIFLERFTYPYRYLDIVSIFARPVPQICKEINNMMNHIYKHFAHLLKQLPLMTSTTSTIPETALGLRMELLDKFTENKKL